MIGFDTTAASISSLRKIAEILGDSSVTSLPKYVKKTMISSRVFIEKEIAEEAIVADTMKVFQNIYIGYILLALQLNMHVTKTKKVRDLLSVVATEGLVDEYITSASLKNDLEFAFSKNKIGMEAREYKSEDKVSFPSGKIVEVTLTAPTDKSKGVTANVFVHLNPRFVPTNIMEQFTSLNFKAPILNRWLMVKAREISFWYDFVFELDLAEKRRNALREDDTGEFAELLKKQKNAITKRLLNAIKGFAHIIASTDDSSLNVSKENRLDAAAMDRSIPGWKNIANSVLVYDASNFDRYSHHAGFNFRKYSDRQKFFAKSYALSVITIDNMEDTVTMYINGFENICQYKFTQMMDSARKDTMNLVTMMKQMSQNQPPRF